MPLTIAEQIQGIKNPRNTIRDKMVDLGVATSVDNLATLATKINSIENKGAVSAKIREGESFAIPAGYHNGSGTVEAVGGGGNYTLQSKTVTPTKQQQSVSSDVGYYGLSSVTVEAIPDSYQDVSSTTASASDVLAPKVFTSADGTETVGTMVERGAIAGTINVLASTSYTVPAGHHNGSGKVTITDDLANALAEI
mgnify:CR=1 FL=1